MTTFARGLIFPIFLKKIIEKYNGTEAATEAQNALDVQNAKKTKDNNN